MKAGRELDALVAEKVFGIVARDTFTGEEKPITSGMALRAMSEGLNVRIPHYSTDIAAAWEVVEKLRDGTHYRDCFSIHSPTDDSNQWFARFDKKWPGHAERYRGENADTAAHAICLAALRAIEIDVAGNL